MLIDALEANRCPLLIIFFICSINSSSSWWQLQTTPSNTISGDDGAACELLSGLTAKQHLVCSQHRTAIRYFIEGLNIAVKHCQQQFSDQQWNCSAGRLGFSDSHLRVGSRETAYVFAITSASTSQAVARACSQGLIASCTCGSNPKKRTHKQFVWAGCSDNIKYANSFGRKFMDAAEFVQSNGARAMMNMHNNRVGRKIVAKNCERECKCHGVSGSCLMKTCWRVAPKVERIASLLRAKYFQAAQVKVSSEHKVSSRYERNTIVRVGRYLTSSKHAILDTELVYVDNSPDYCVENEWNDVYAPRGRFCGNNCDRLCCGRGFETRRSVISEQCRCKFVWCCEVRCETCRRIVDRNYCR